MPNWMYRRWLDRKVYFEGVYKCFEDIPATQDTKPEYHNLSSLEFDKARMKVVADDLHSTIGRVDRGEFHARYSVLAALVSGFPTGRLRVLDIGGGAGYGFSYVLRACPSHEICYHILDLPEIRRLGKEVFATVSNLEYVDNIPSDSYDVAFFGASIQCFGSPIGFLESVCANAPEIIAIVDSPLTDGPTFCSTQISLKGRIIPSCILNREDLCRFFEAAGYSLILRVCHTGNAENFRRFPAPHDQTYYWTHAFRRRQQGCGSI